MKYENEDKTTVQKFSRDTQFYFVKNFSSQNIWRMKQFYETCAKNRKLSPLVRENNQINNLLIMMSAKSDDDDVQNFSLLLLARNNYANHELKCQIVSSLYEQGAR